MTPRTGTRGCSTCSPSSGDGTTLWNQNTWSQRLTDGATKTALKSNDLWFEGPATSPRAKLYAPSTWEPGSSYSHLDEKKYPRGSLNSMMTPIGDFGEGNADAGPLVLQIFEDMGWGLPTDRTCAKPGDLDSDGFNDVVGVASNGDLTWAPGTDTGKLLKRKVASAGFGGFKPMVIEDWTGDGCADLIAYTPADGHIYALPVTGSFDVGTFVDIVDFTGWTVTGIAAVGDFTDDGNNDLIVRANEVSAVEKGQLWLLAGNGAGSRSRARTASCSWAPPSVASPPAPSRNSSPRATGTATASATCSCVPRRTTARSSCSRATGPAASRPRSARAPAGTSTTSCSGRST